MQLIFIQMVLNLTEKKQMQDSIFLDTNIILYAYSIDEKAKINIAQNILDDYNIAKQNQTTE